MFQPFMIDMATEGPKSRKIFHDDESHVALFIVNNIDPFNQRKMDGFKVSLSVCSNARTKGRLPASQTKLGIELSQNVERLSGQV